MLSAYSAMLWRDIDHPPYRTGFPLEDGTFDIKEVILDVSLGQAPQPT